jgi:hypothetical protein
VNPVERAEAAIDRGLAGLYLPAAKIAEIAYEADRMLLEHFGEYPPTWWELTNEARGRLTDAVIAVERDDQVAVGGSARYVARCVEDIRSSLTQRVIEGLHFRAPPR